jgi:phospholipid/cholesterol/gamma-HCH transport system permease protein
MTTTQQRPGPPGQESEPTYAAPKTEGVRVGVAPAAEKVRASFETAGEIASFTGKTMKDFPDMFRRYVPEVFHQTGILILSSGLIIWFMEFVMGSECGLEASYTLEQIGAPLYSGVFDAYCGLRELSVYMWGWILAAKVGCGFVAEIGSMRISDEIDAMEVMGIKSKAYLVGTRIAATIIAVPFLYLVGLEILNLGMYFVTVIQLSTISAGSYHYIFWLYQNPYDLIGAMTKVMAESIVIAGIGLFYGYNASGGPVGVGRATAKSMILNLVLISMIGMIGTMLFWGIAPNAPIAN